jgi:hypothetical protein
MKRPGGKERESRGKSQGSPAVRGQEPNPESKPDARSRELDAVVS